jgi:hypothetical protein
VLLVGDVIQLRPLHDPRAVQHPSDRPCC